MSLSLSYPNNEARTSITKAAYSMLLDYCGSILPNEACGVLAREKERHSIDIILPIRNIHPHPSDSFYFDPEEWTAACFSMEKNRQQLVGFFHSHPNTAAIPSNRDGEGFHFHSGFQYWIISLTDPSAPVVQPYRHQDGVFMPAQLVFA
ncbi:hypothetical protein B1748_07200 [Paenibacillus sp. MY03]|uniref:Mov34/MPN/PAD-1 family protein n=1 Tax=Paenibacillus sp. MY03 TaxID=302980 RepID=UPI000B3C2E64|nr:M67 family metallopeptidase [Paenibacillus sp. MY03]OUS77578.1 hypothetical protein B1748_07200 [Paenibacillus sp. MY03]